VNEIKDAYLQGMQEFAEGAKMDDCPFSGPSDLGKRQKCAWLDGFLDARTDHRLGPMLRRWGISTMTEDRGIA